MTHTSDGIQLGTPLRSKRVESRSARGRHCAHPDCSTVLSTYNSSATCWVHTEPSYRRPLDRE